jgi:hypothetical protein
VEPAENPVLQMELLSFGFPRWADSKSETRVMSCVVGRGGGLAPKESEASADADADAATIRLLLNECLSLSVSL